MTTHTKMTKVRTTPRKTAEERAEISRINGGAPPPELYYPKAEVRYTDDNNEYDLSELYSSRARYAPELKIAAATAYVMTGTVKGVERLTGLKQQTISEWKNSSSWWPDLVSRIKKEKQDNVDAIMTNIIHEAGTQVLDRILNGDEVLDKNGDIIRKKMSGKDTAMVMAITWDKRALVRGEPTSRSEKVDQRAIMEELKEQFAEIAASALKNSAIDVTPKVEEE